MYKRYEYGCDRMHTECRLVTYSKFVFTKGSRGVYIALEEKSSYFQYKLSHSSELHMCALHMMSTLTSTLRDLKSHETGEESLCKYLKQL